MVKSLIRYILLLFVLWGCSQGGSKVSVNIKNSFALSSMPGGAVIYLENLDAGTVSAAVITGESYKVTLTNANWKFTVVGWDGSSPMTGKMNCGVSQMLLAGTNSAIDITINEANCLSDDISVGGYRIATGVMPLNLVTCLNLSSASAAGTCDGAAKGLSGSYKVRLIDYSSVNLNAVKTSSTGLSSSCIQGSSSTDSVTSTNLKIPFGRVDGLFATVIDSYTDTSCLSGKRSYLFAKGVASSSGSAQVVYSDSSQAKVFMVHGGLALQGTTNFGGFISPASVPNFVTIVNSTGVDIIPNAMTFTGNSANWSFEGGTFPGTSGTCGFGATLTNGSTCTIEIKFSATAIGNYPTTAKLTYSDDGGVSSKNLSSVLTGSVVTPAALSFTHATTQNTFGSHYIGVASPVRNLIVKNNGGFPAAFSDINGFTYPFSMNATSSCVGGGTLAPGSTCTISINMATGTVGPASTAIQVNYNSGSSALTISQAISGTIIAAADASPSVANWDFGNINVGTNTYKDIVISNPTTFTATGLIFPANTTEFITTSNTCTTTLAPSASCQIRVSFYPTAEGPRSNVYSYSFNNGSVVVTKNIGLTGTGLVDGSPSVANFDFGPVASGGYVDQLITVTNYIYGTPLTLVTTVLSNPAFTFVGGSYPGTGGSCGTTIPTGGNCSMNIRFSPTALVAYNSNLTITFTNSSGTYPSASALSGTGAYPAAVTVSDGGAFDFGTVTTGSSGTKIFTFTNNGASRAFSILASAPGSGFSVSSNGCTTSLDPSTSCNMTFAFIPASAGAASKTFTISYFDGLTNQTLNINLQARGVVNGTVDPFYASASAWNKYVVDDNTSSLFLDTGTLCNPATNTFCQHAGELRKVTIPGVYLCSNITYTELLGVFEWQCDDNGSMGPVVLRSTGFKKGKGLRDLLVAGAWKPNSMQVFESGTLVFSSNPAPWFSNPVVSINSIHGQSVGATLPTSAITGVAGVNISGGTTSGTLVAFNLTQPNTIYTISIPIVSAPVILSAEGIAVVSVAGTGSLNSSATTPTCYSTNAQVVSADTNAVICGGAFDFNWLEVKSSGAATVANLLYLRSPRFYRIHNSDLSLASNLINISHTSAPVPRTNWITSTNAYGASGMGLLAVNSSNMKVVNSAFFNTSYGIYLQGTGSGNLFEQTASVKNMNAGIKVETGIMHNRFMQFIASNNGGGGIELYSSMNIFNVVKTAGNQVFGFRLDGASNNTITSLLSIQNSGSGLDIEGVSNSNTFLNGTLANNTEGIMIDGSHFNTFVNYVSYHGTNGLTINSGTGNKFDKLVLSHNDTNASLSSANATSITTLLTGDKQSSFDCIISGSSGITIQSTGVSNGTSAACPNAVSVATSLNTVFKGKVTTDTVNTQISGSAVTFGSITPGNLIQFQNPFLYWAPNSTDYFDATAVGACTGLCSALDWRLASAATEISAKSGDGLAFNDTFVSGATCPSQMAGNKSTTDFATTPNTFLSLATEIMDDIGDNDGLCESGEACLSSPNFGAFQGQGVVTGSCLFSDGTVSGVTLRAFTDNAAL